MMLVLTWVHLVAAIVWIGGMVFLSVVMVPVLNQEPRAHRPLLFQAVGRRFRVLVWISVVVLLLSGMLLLSGRVKSLLVPEDWPLVAQVKVLLVLALITFTALHDFWLGPLVGRLRRERPTELTQADKLVIRVSPWLARLGLILALAIVLVAAALVRGD